MVTHLVILKWKSRSIYAIQIPKAAYKKFTIAGLLRNKGHRHNSLPLTSVQYHMLERSRIYM